MHAPIDPPHRPPSIPTLHTGSETPIRHRGRWRLPAALWTLGAIAVLTAIARIASTAAALAGAPTPPDFDGTAYVQHPWIAAGHIIPGILLLLSGPLQLSQHFRRRHPVAHRRLGWVFVVSGTLLATCGIWMNEYFPPVGGPLKYVTTHLFGAALLVFIVLAMRAVIIHRDYTAHRRHMIRAFAIGLAPATQRLLIIPAYLALGELSDSIIDIGMSAGWLLNIAIAEAALVRGRLVGQR